MNRQFGLIGFPLTHSFSGKYFAEKFAKEGINDCAYTLYEIDDISKVAEIFQIPSLAGFNVTIPYKHAIIDYLDAMDASAVKVGAVNVVKIGKDGSKTGFNSDYYGFRTSLEKWLPVGVTFKALILGYGGAAKAVEAVLHDMDIPFLIISRDVAKGHLTYDKLKAETGILDTHRLIINTTPLGMSPMVDSMPDLAYNKLTDQHFLYDLIYNPAETRFMATGKLHKAHTKNGHEMLILQAEKSWEIWNT